MLIRYCLSKGLIRLANAFSVNIHKMTEKIFNEIMLRGMKTLIFTEAHTNEFRRAHRAAKNKKDAATLI